MTNKYLEKVAGLMGGVKAFGKKLAGTDAKAAAEALKKTHASRETLKTRIDLTKKFKAHSKQTNIARAGVAGGTAAAVGAGMLAAKKDKSDKK